jgi:hypothetical protein
MRKRRVGVTARSRQIVGGQATGSLQIATEIAAPLELRTPRSTAAQADNRVRMEVWRQGRWSQWQKTNPKRVRRSATRARDLRKKGRALCAHEALPHTPPGGKPPETPAPFPSGSMFQNGGNLSRVRKPRPNGAPLTDCHRSEEPTEMRERGPSENGPSRAPRWDRDGALCAHEALPHAPPGGKPPETPMFSLDREWPSHGSRDREGAVGVGLRAFAPSPGALGPALIA